MAVLQRNYGRGGRIILLLLRPARLDRGGVCKACKHAAAATCTYNPAPRGGKTRGKGGCGRRTLQGASKSAGPGGCEWGRTVWTGGQLRRCCQWPPRDRAAICKPAPAGAPSFKPPPRRRRRGGGIRTGRVKTGSCAAGAADPGRHCHSCKNSITPAWRGLHRRGVSVGAERWGWRAGCTC